MELRDNCNGKWKEQSIALSVPDPEDPASVVAYIICPPEGPTGNYIFSIDVKFPPSYPFDAPMFTFKHKVWHPKLQFTSGNICIPEFTVQWFPATNVNTILFSIVGMFVRVGRNTPHGVIYLNSEAAEQLWEDEEEYNKMALQWAEKDNCGYGMAQFEDLRLKAIQSCLRIDVASYECHFFCQSSKGLEVKVVAVVIPSLTIYRDKVEKHYLSTMKRLTTQEFKFKSDGTAVIRSNEFSRDKCWKISLPGTTFTKSEVDKVDPRKESPPHCIITLTWCRPETKPGKFTEKFQITDGDGNELRSFSIHVDPSQLAASTEGGEKPTLPQLINVPLPSGKPINLTRVIGGNYFDLGVYLLNDDDGSAVGVIEANNRGNVQAIAREILREWLRGGEGGK